MTDAPRLYCETQPNLPRAWDSTMLRSYMTCPRKFQLEHLEGWRRKGSSDDLIFGQLYHAALELADKMRLGGAPKDAAMDAALAQALEQSWGWESLKNQKTRYTLARAVVWYIDEFYENDAVEPFAFPDGTPAVELSFRIPLPKQTPDGDNYLLCGHLDGLCTWLDAVRVRERKSTRSTLSSSYFHRYSPDVQIDTYDLAGALLFPELGIKGTLLEACQTAVGFARFGKQHIRRMEAHREEWLAELLAWIDRAEQDAKRGHWPMNTAACHVNGGCPFRDICAKVPGLREKALRADFEKSHWNPLEER